MAERIAQLELPQLGIEVTEGTSVVATKRLTSLSLDLGIMPTFSREEAMGYKAASLVDPVTEYSPITGSGNLTYTEIIYILSSLLKYQLPTNGGVSTTSKVWTFDPSSTAVETVKSYTIEQGQTARAAKAAGVKFDACTITLDRMQGCRVTCGGFGQLYTDGITMTALTSANEVPLVPVLGSQLDFFLDPTAGAFGTTKLLRATRMEFVISGMWNRLFAANTANTSYATSIQGNPNMTASLTLQADAAGMAQLTNMRAGSTFYLRGKATGAATDVPNSRTYSFIMDLCVKVNGQPRASTDQGQRAVTWPLEVVHDSGYGRAFTISSENLLATL